MGILKLTDSTLEIMKKLSQGNPGALRVLWKIAQLDPLSIVHLFKMDDMGIYGPMIWLLYKDTFNFGTQALYFALCNNRIPKVVARKKALSPAFAKEWDYYSNRHQQEGDFHF